MCASSVAFSRAWSQLSPVFGACHAVHQLAGYVDAANQLDFQLHASTDADTHAAVVD